MEDATVDAAVFGVGVTPDYAKISEENIKEFLISNSEHVIHFIGIWRTLSLYFYIKRGPCSVFI